jgi:hypothetical protein
VIAYNATELAGEVSIAPLEQKVVKAMVRLRDEDGYALNFGGIEQFPVQMEVAFQGLQVLAYFFDIFGFRFKNGT